jgi:truncated hemoglobin YjbI
MNKGSIFEVAGGAPAFERLTSRFYGKVKADPGGSSSSHPARDPESDQTCCVPKCEIPGGAARI